MRTDTEFEMVQNDLAATEQQVRELLTRIKVAQEWFREVDAIVLKATMPIDGSEFCDFLRELHETIEQAQFELRKQS